MLNSEINEAIRLVFRQEDALSRQIIGLLLHAKCIEKEETGIGYYATILFDNPVIGVEIPCMRDFNFSHPRFLYGGTFICTLLSVNKLELEAVSFGGELWPKKLNVEEFEPLDD